MTFQQLISPSNKALLTPNRPSSSPAVQYNPATAAKAAATGGNGLDSPANTTPSTDPRLLPVPQGGGGLTGTPTTTQQHFRHPSGGALTPGSNQPVFVNNQQNNPNHIQHRSTPDHVVHPQQQQQQFLLNQGGNRMNSSNSNSSVNNVNLISSSHNSNINLGLDSTNQMGTAGQMSGNQPQHISPQLINNQSEQIFQQQNKFNVNSPTASNPPGQLRQQQPTQLSLSSS